MSPRPSWRPLIAGTIGLFLVIFAFLAGQLRSGGDPALGRTTASEVAPDSGGFGTDPSSPDGSQSGDDGFVPGGSAPAPAVPDGSPPSRSSDAPATHQS